MFFDHLGHFGFVATQIGIVDDFVAAICKMQQSLRKKTSKEMVIIELNVVNGGTFRLLMLSIGKSKQYPKFMA
jgi:hypothetical protein